MYISESIINFKIVFTYFHEKNKNKISVGLTFRVKISRQKQQKSIDDAMAYSHCLYYREYIILAQVRQHPQISGVSSPDLQQVGGNGSYQLNSTANLANLAQI